MKLFTPSSPYFGASLGARADIASAVSPLCPLRDAYTAIPRLLQHATSFDAQHGRFTARSTLLARVSSVGRDAESPDLAAASRLLEAVPRTTTVQQLQEVVAEARTQGCLTTAHTAAALVQLGALASPAQLPEEANAARRLGNDLVAILQRRPGTLSPALSSMIERTVMSLKLRPLAGLGPAPASPQAPAAAGGPSLPGPRGQAATSRQGGRKAKQGAGVAAGGAGTGTRPRPGPGPQAGVQPVLRQDQQQRREGQPPLKQGDRAAQEAVAGRQPLQPQRKPDGPTRQEVEASLPAKPLNVAASIPARPAAPITHRPPPGPALPSPKAPPADPAAVASKADVLAATTGRCLDGDGSGVGPSSLHPPITDPNSGGAEGGGSVGASPEAPPGSHDGPPPLMAADAVVSAIGSSPARPAPEAVTCQPQDDPIAAPPAAPLLSDLPKASPSSVTSAASTTNATPPSPPPAEPSPAASPQPPHVAAAAAAPATPAGATTAATAATAATATTAATAATANPLLPSLPDALRMAWDAQALLQLPLDAFRSNTRVADTALLEAALQQLPPAAMPVSQVAEVLQLLLELRLLPRYDWLLAADARLKVAMAEAEAEIAAGARVDAASRLVDLRSVYDVLADVKQMCWEADGQRWDQQGEEAEQERASSVMVAGGGDGGCCESVAGGSEFHTNGLEAHGAASGLTCDAANIRFGLSSDSGTGLPAGSELRSEAGQGTGREVAEGVLSLEMRAEPEGSPAAGVGGQRGEGQGGQPLSPHQSAAVAPASKVDALATTAATQSLEATAAAAAAAAEEDRGKEKGEATGADEGGAWEGAVAAAARLGPPVGAGSRCAEDSSRMLLLRLWDQLRRARGQEAPGGSSSSSPVLPGWTSDEEPDGADPAGARRAAVQELSSFLSEALQAEALRRGPSVSPSLEPPATGSGGAWSDDAPAPPPRPVLTPPALAALVSTASRLQPQLPSRLLSAAVRLLFGMRGSLVSAEHVAPLVEACVAAAYTPPEYQLEQLAAAAFALPAADVAAAAAAVAERPTPPAAWLHRCAQGLRILGFRLNNKQFGAWVEAATVGSPLEALSPPQLQQLLEACLERRFALRPAAAAALFSATVMPAEQLSQLSASEATRAVLFAAQQGLQLRPRSPPGTSVGAAGGSGSNSAAAAASAADTGVDVDPLPLLQHLQPRLADLPLSQLASLLPALQATGVLRPGSAEPWLAAHSAALLPLAESLQLGEVLGLLRMYDQLGYTPPRLLLLGMALGVEAGLAAQPLPEVLEALQLLLCRFGLQPNEGLALAIRDDLIPRIMVAATQKPQSSTQSSSPLSSASQAQARGKGAAGSAAASSCQPAPLSLAQRLQVLDVLAAARVRPHPAQLAAVLEVQLMGEGRMQELPGEDLARLLWRCVAFQALPSWRFVGEWLEASAAAIKVTVQAGGGAAGAAGSGDRSVSPPALARMAWCLGQIGVVPEQSWQAEYQAALAGAFPVLDGEALSLVAHSALTLRSRPGEEWLEGLMRAALARMAELDAASAARLLHFAAAAEISVSKDWMQSFFVHTLRHLEPQHDPAPPPLVRNPAGAAAGPPAPPAPALSATPDQIALMLRALAQLGYRPPDPWLHAALDRVQSAAASLSPACFPVLLTALARVVPDVAGDLGPGSVVDKLVRVAHSQRARFSKVELLWLLETLGLYYPAYQMPMAAQANLVAALRRLEAQEAAVAEGQTEEGEDGGQAQGDVAAALGDEVSEAWLCWR